MAITVAPLAQAYYDDVDSVPTPKRLAQEIVECCQEGASVVHLHVIDEKRNATVGAAFSLFLMPFLIMFVGWRLTFVINGIIGVIWVTLWLVWTPNG